MLPEAWAYLECLLFSFKRAHAIYYPLIATALLCSVTVLYEGQFIWAQYYSMLDFWKLLNVFLAVTITRSLNYPETGKYIVGRAQIHKHLKHCAVRHVAFFKSSLKRTFLKWHTFQGVTQASGSVFQGPCENKRQKVKKNSTIVIAVASVDVVLQTGKLLYRNKIDSFIYTAHKIYVVISVLPDMMASHQCHHKYAGWSIFPMCSLCTHSVAKDLSEM